MDVVGAAARGARGRPETRTERNHHPTTSSELANFRRPSQRRSPRSPKCGGISAMSEAPDPAAASSSGRGFFGFGGAENPVLGNPGHSSQPLPMPLQEVLQTLVEQQKQQQMMMESRFTALEDRLMRRVDRFASAVASNSKADPSGCLGEDSMVLHRESQRPTVESSFTSGSYVHRPDGSRPLELDGHEMTELRQTVAERHEKEIKEKNVKEAKKQEKFLEKYAHDEVFGRSKADIEHERLKNIEKTERDFSHQKSLKWIWAHYTFMILPSSGLRLFWDATSMILVIFIAMTLPYRVAYLMDCPSVTFASLDVFIDLFFITDIFLNFRTVRPSAPCARRTPPPEAMTRRLDTRICCRLASCLPPHGRSVASLASHRPSSRTASSTRMRGSSPADTSRAGSCSTSPPPSPSTGFLRTASSQTTSASCPLTAPPPTSPPRSTSRLLAAPAAPAAPLPTCRPKPSRCCASSAWSSCSGCCASPASSATSRGGRSSSSSSTRRRSACSSSASRCSSSRTGTAASSSSSPPSTEMATCAARPWPLRGPLPWALSQRMVAARPIEPLEPL